MTRVLILYSSGGGVGHKSAALALEEAFRQRGVSEVRSEDALKHGSSLYRELYTSFYVELSENAPTLWEYIYELADNNETKFVNEIRTFLDRLGVTELDNLVEAYQPDTIVCTHFLPLHLLARQKRKGLLADSIPLSAVVTDYTGHAYWVYPEVDRYFIASHKTGAMLIERGASESALTLTGIPINPAIAEPKDREQIRQEYQIAQEPVLLLIGSAIDNERVYTIVQGLIDEQLSGTLFVVAGRNESLQASLQDIEHTVPSDRLDMRVLGFVDYLDDLIVASDLVITKAGGLIVSEIMARHTPMVVIDPIRGQEEWNADHIVSMGAGSQVRMVGMVPSLVVNILQSPERLELMAHLARQAARPQAALTIADAVLGSDNLS